MATTEFAKLENNAVKLTVTVDAKEFEDAVQKVYLRMKPQLQIPGFRKGKVSRAMAEKKFGKELFYNDAIEEIIQRTYPVAVLECGEEVVGTPQFELEKIGPEGMIYTAEVTVKPSVTLGSYEGIKVPKAEVAAVTEEEIEEQIEAARLQYAVPTDIVNRAVKDGDTIRLDFQGTIDGKPFANGSAKDYPLAIGSGMFIPGFEEQLIGVLPGNVVDVNLSFPEDYADADLRGKEAVFHCKVNTIVESELPEVDDAFAKKAAGVDTVDAYRELLRSRLLEAKKAEQSRVQQEAIMNALIEETQIDVPDVMIQEDTDRMVQDFLNRMEQQGMPAEQYFQVTGTTVEMLAEEMRPHAEKKVRGKLILEQIAKEQALEVTEEEVDMELVPLLEEIGGGRTVQDVREAVGEGFLANVRSDLEKQKAQRWLLEHAVEEA